MPTRIVDLTHILNEKITVYPDNPMPRFEALHTIEKDGFAEIEMTMVFHSGAHIDAPCHILKDTKSLDQFPIEKFIGNALVIPCQDKNEITLEYLKTFESKLASVDFVLFFTGWQYKWNTEDYLDDCPVPTMEATTWLTKFKLKGVGFDAFSVDKMIPAREITSESLPNHHILLGKDILLIENLTNLDKLPSDIFSFQCLPIYIEDADGSPVRAIGIINE